MGKVEEGHIIYLHLTFISKEAVAMLIINLIPNSNDVCLLGLLFILQKSLSYKGLQNNLIYDNHRYGGLNLRNFNNMRILKIVWKSFKTKVIRNLHWNWESCL